MKRLLKGKILWYKHRLAAWLNQHTRYYSKRRWFLLLTLFTLIIGATSAYLILTSINP